MVQRKADNILRHVAVALDASVQSSQAITIAAELALMLEASLEGIFVEDINLIRIAELPTTRVIRPSSLNLESIDLQRMERELRSIARQERLRLEQVARDKGVNCSFSIRRGSMRSELLDCISRVDVLAVNLSRFQHQHKFWQRSTTTARRFPTAAAPDTAPVSVLFSGIDKDNQTLLTAASFATRLDRPLNVIIYGDSPEKSSKHQASAESLLGDVKTRVNYIKLVNNTLTALVDAVVRTSSEMLLVNSNTLQTTDELTWKSLERLPCPVLLVR